MIRKAKLTDFPLVYPILKQIFDEMDMDTIKALPESQFYDLMKHRGIENCLVYPSMNKFNFLNVNTRYDTNKLQKLKDTKYPGKFVLATKKPTAKEQEAISSSTCIVKPVTRPDFMEKIDAKVKDYHFYPKKTQ